MDRKLLTFITSGAVVLAAIAQPRAAQSAQVTAAMHAHASINSTVSEYLRIQTAGLPGRVEYSVGAIDPRLVVPACSAPEVFTPSGARLWGKTNVGVRCASPTAWTIYVPVTIRVTSTYLVATRALAHGHALAVDDYTTATGDLTQLPAGVARDASQVLGRTLAGTLASGQPLRSDLLRAPTVILQGQSVKLIARGNGFEVTAEGKALSQGALGQVVQVRSPSGQTVTGIARSDGAVEVSH